MDNKEKCLYYIWLSLALGPASIVTDKLLSLFDGDIERLYKADKEEYDTVPQLRDRLSERLNDKDLTTSKKIYDYCNENSVVILHLESEKYPSRLRTLIDKPIVLYAMGNIDEINIDMSLCIAVVGTRHLTYYGERNTYTIAYDLARSGAVIVSGMAAGCDSFAHRACLDCGGKTVAVLGCGIDIVYPAINKELMAEIIEKGLVITEYAPGTPPLKYHFPQRNRLVSGLSNGVFVTEAPLTSGAIITAKLAISQGRQVFSMPGKIGETNSKGTNELIQNGAKAVICASDITSEFDQLFNSIPVQNNKSEQRSIEHKTKVTLPKAYNKTSENRKSIARERNEKNVSSDGFERQKALASINNLTEQQRAVYNLVVSHERISADEIVKYTGLNATQVSVILTMLELKRLVEVRAGGFAVPVFEEQYL